MRQKVELLAPAGDIKCLKAAIHAGADAVYVGGSRFGARAYAHNFDEQELCQAIDYVHFFGKKLYLTLNTLLKDEELDEVPEYVRPFYETGLDGIIVQDFGVVKILRAHFPDMEIHASTQMTVTGVYGALELKKMGISRVVPARELSIEEIQEIYEGADIEVETFIHGAMCYSYSGQCLFSSFLGGRSGNRGRCAGPCRLPYDIVDIKGRQINSKKEQYLLSLKDMCTLEILPELMEAGIASFKIEGRMKSPEYVAGVTSIYRKYIDLYQCNKENFSIEREDINNLMNLYTRGTICTGYYQRHNGRDMVTLTKGSYENSVSQYTEVIKERYVEKDKKLFITGNAVFSKNQPGSLEIHLLSNTEGQEINAEAKTTLDVMVAQNRPMEEADIRRQLIKTGNSEFVFDDLTIQKDDDIFIPNKELNDLRRNALEALKEKILTSYRRSYKQPELSIEVKNMEFGSLTGGLAVSILTEEQLKAVLQSDFIKQIRKIYFPYRLFLQLLQEGGKEIKQCKKMGIVCFVAFSAVTRKREKAEYLCIFNNQNKLKFLEEADGFLVNNLESFGFIKKILKEESMEKVIQSDYGMYSFNKEAGSFLKEMGIEYMTAPFEWSKHEMKVFQKRGHGQTMEVIVYGYIPLMESVNCIYKTVNQCKMKKGDQCLFLKDRYQTRFPVITDCISCKNTILNSVPLSLYKEWNTIVKYDNLDYRLHFTIEDFETTGKIIQQFGNLIGGEVQNRDISDGKFTTGHFRKGVL